MDKRWEQLGELLVHYSTGVRKGEKVVIVMNEMVTYPLAKAVYKACILEGAYPVVHFLSEDLNRLLLKYGSEDQIEWLPETEVYNIKWADVYFGLRGAYNPSVFWDIPPERIAKFRDVRGKISALRWSHTRWSLVKVPNVNLAQLAGVDEETLLDVFFSACFVDWERESKIWHRWASVLEKGKIIRIVGEKTDLKFSVERRKWQVDDGKINMPGGEIFTSPIESTVDGQIYFEEPAIIGGQFIHGVQLRWNKGKLVEATSVDNQDLLRAVISTDPGAQNIGEFAIGTNDHIRYFFRDTLIDEKIGGTVHIALGRAYPETGGTNYSAIHWDIVKDLRGGGKVYMDDTIVLEDGKMRL